MTGPSGCSKGNSHGSTLNSLGGGQTLVDERPDGVYLKESPCLKTFPKLG